MKGNLNGFKVQTVHFVIEKVNDMSSALYLLPKPFLMAAYHALKILPITKVVKSQENTPINKVSMKVLSLILISLGSTLSAMMTASLPGVRQKYSKNIFQNHTFKKPER